MQWRRRDGAGRRVGQLALEARCSCCSTSERHFSSLHGATDVKHSVHSNIAGFSLNHARHAMAQTLHCSPMGVEKAKVADCVARAPFGPEVTLTTGSEHSAAVVPSQAGLPALVRMPW